MRECIFKTEHKPNIELRSSHDLTLYHRGIDDGQHGRLYDPCTHDRDDTAIYKAGFDIAREQRRI